jgi:hypothetical protein
MNSNQFLYSDPVPQIKETSCQLLKLAIANVLNWSGQSISPKAIDFLHKERTMKNLIQVTLSMIANSVQVQRRSPLTDEWAIDIENYLLNSKGYSIENFPSFPLGKDFFEKWADKPISSSSDPEPKNHEVADDLSLDRIIGYLNGLKAKDRNQTIRAIAGAFGQTVSYPSGKSAVTPAKQSKKTKRGKPNASNDANQKSKSYLNKEEKRQLSLIKQDHANIVTHLKSFNGRSLDRKEKSEKANALKEKTNNEKTQKDLRRKAFNRSE